MLKLKEFREKKGLSQVKLGEILGLSKQTISTYELGTREPNIETLSKIAIVLDVTIDELIDFRKIYDQVHEELYSKVNEIVKENK
ncbi:helix-turn-helix transcriptional regulator [Acholeplasma equirhinis]|uniref:helix-turn-helix domain-containing protein n=1 Tax=Acholeplasma equirhinis TaxID=555393 RepID=UPI00197ABBAC|nr:helix-turn-helix transcriptional regulator [Acholeplasma equirhinis]MBN3490527.1 helix-turn-helix transcriptional regulator [Acholeplasma equirhinis]